jgi:hypothetical protein
LAYASLHRIMGRNQDLIRDERYTYLYLRAVDTAEFWPPSRLLCGNDLD